MSELKIHVGFRQKQTGGRLVQIPRPCVPATSIEGEEQAKKENIKGGEEPEAECSLALKWGHS